MTNSKQTRSVWKKYSPVALAVASVSAVIARNALVNNNSGLGIPMAIVTILAFIYMMIAMGSPVVIAAVITPVVLAGFMAIGAVLFVTTNLAKYLDKAPTVVLVIGFLAIITFIAYVDIWLTKSMVAQYRKRHPQK